MIICSIFRGILNKCLLIDVNRKRLYSLPLDGKTLRLIPTVISMAKKLTLILATPPYDKIGAFTGARIALTAAMEELDTTVILMEDGVYAALNGQQSTQFFKTVQLLEDFREAGGKILVCGLCLKERGIPEGNVIDGIEVIDIHKLVAAIAESDQTIFFGA